MNTVVRYRNGKSIFDQMDDIMESMLTNSWSTASTGPTPAIDIREEKDRYVLEAELPGMTQENIDISVEDGRLKLEAKAEKIEKKADDEDKAEKSEGKYLLRERRDIRFTRSFGLPRDVDSENISAEFSNGLLTLVIPKSEAAKPRQIKIS